MAVYPGDLELTQYDGGKRVLRERLGDVAALETPDLLQLDDERFVLLWSGIQGTESNLERDPESNLERDPESDLERDPESNLERIHALERDPRSRE